MECPIFDLNTFRPSVRIRTVGPGRGIHQHLIEEVDIRSHMQRGGPATAQGQVLASRFGSAAVEALVEPRSRVMVEMIGGEIRLTPLKHICGQKKRVNHDLLQLPDILS